MSSRRKSKPVRRLEARCEETPKIKLSEEQPPENNLVLSSSESPVHLPGKQVPAQEINFEEDQKSPDETVEKENATENQESAPEGVYVLEPQGFSDDEGQDTMETERYVGNTKAWNRENGESKKRFRDEKIGFEEKQGHRHHGNLMREGLDLSVKRRRTEEGRPRNHVSSVSEDPFISSSDRDAQSDKKFEMDIQRCKEVLRMLAQQQHQTASKLRQQDVAALHQLCSQLPQDDSAWKHGSHDSNNQSDDEENDTSLESTKLAASSVSFNSTVAAMMNSFATGGERGEFFPVNYRQASSLLSQLSPPQSLNEQYIESADAMDSITSGTVSSGVGSIKKGTLDPTNFDEDVFDKYITKFTTNHSCRQAQCPHLNRDHYHCTDSDCSFQRFTNKSDVIRHYNMHKKRDNSLAHGFMRVSPSDDCSPQFGLCQLKGKSTHYHCLHSNCTKVYTSTSDVMTHENFHKKNHQFVTNGFQRYRATEICGSDSCFFRSQRTTHFHCTRKDCNFTFKNKCDIEKHKSYHTRDDAYARQGFKKYYKNEACQFPSCAWNRTANHFHCLRTNCEFSFTSTSQMVSHKRKHDRQELIGVPDTSGSELHRSIDSKIDSSFYHDEVRKVLANNSSAAATASLQRDLSGLIPKSEPLDVDSAFIPTSLSPASNGADGNFHLREKSTLPNSGNFELPSTSFKNSAAINSASFDENDCYDREISVAEHNRLNNKRLFDLSRDSSPLLMIKGDGQALNLSSRTETLDGADSVMNSASTVSKYFTRFAPDECTVKNCIFVSQPHFHCIVQDCCALFTDKQLVLNHTIFHEKLEQLGVTQVARREYSPLFPSSSRRGSPHGDNSSPKGHMSLLGSNHPNVGPNCVISEWSNEVARMAAQDHNADETAEGTDLNKINLHDYTAQAHSTTEFNDIFEGRHRKVDSLNFQVQNTVKQFMERHKTLYLCNDQTKQTNEEKNDGYVHIRQGMPCIRQDCKYGMQTHWHCSLNRCRYVCKSLGKAQSHREAHDNLEAYAKASKEWFKSYTVKKICPNVTCEFRLRGHYHCLKRGCQFVTIGTSKLPWHMKKHEKIAKREASGFKYYTKKEHCGKKECKYDGLFSHYHCIRAGCGFAFQYKHQMSTHVRKHLRRTLGRTCNSSNFSNHVAVNHAAVDSGDDSLPLVVDETDELEQLPGVAPDTLPIRPQPEDPTSQLNENQLAVLERISKGGTLQSTPCYDNSENDTSQFSMNTPDHANADDSPSDEEVLDLRAGIALEVDSNSMGSGSNGFHSDQANAGGMEKYNAGIANVVHSMAQENSFSGCNLKQLNRHEEQGSFFNKFKLNNDILEGFERFEGSMDCGEPSCNYSCKVSHYHCLRQDCNYRFTGRTHMFKHHQHHKRVAGLVLDDFKRYKPSPGCDVPECSYNGVSTHFHCLKCEFKCTDTAKVGTHRRQHEKADSLEQWGFQWLRGKEECKRDNCKYRERNTSHFHCLQPGCSYAVVGLASIELHYKKHKIQKSNKFNPQLNFSVQIMNRNANATKPSDLSINSAAHTKSYTFPISAVMNNSNASELDADHVTSFSDDSPTSESQLASNALQNGGDEISLDLSQSLNLSITDQEDGAIAGVGL